MRKLFFALIVLSVVPCKSQTVDSTLYVESPITLHTSTGTISGTLCIPSHAKRFPVALIIAGSGPTNRDGNSMPGESCEPYKILAHRLAVNNIASVRYDKRGVGESMGAVTSESDLRFDNYIDDARAWIDTLKKSGRYMEVIVIGHSEGSLIGMIAAKSADKYISIAGAGNKATIDMKRQFANMPEGLRDTADAILDSLNVGHLVSHVPVKLWMLFRKSVQPYMISWLKYDPQTEIRKLHLPILIIQGTNDVQVDTSDARLLSAANPKAKLVLIKNMNHVFRIVTGDDRAENIKTYNEPDLPISDTLVKEISEFINTR